MTISVTYAPDTYSGNDVLDTFAITFSFLSTSTNIKVSIKVDSTGAITEKTASTHYNVTGSNVVFTGGNIPATGETVIIELDPDYLQQSDYTENASLPAETLEADLDERCLESQLNNDQMLRALRVDSSEDISAANLSIGFPVSGTEVITITDAGILGSALPSSFDTLLLPVSIANGGTAATTEAAARTNLGVAIGSDVHAYDANLTSISANISIVGDDIKVAGGAVFLHTGSASISADSTYVYTNDVLGVARVFVGNSVGDANIYYQLFDNAGVSEVRYRDSDSAVVASIDSNGNADFVASITSPVWNGATIVNTGTLTLPTSTDTLVGRATTDTLTNKTITSAVLNSTISGTSIKDEDTMSSDSASHLATQQSIKAYVDNTVGWTAISETTASAAASVEFTGLSTAYRAYKVIATRIFPATDSTDLRMTISDDGGSTYESSATYSYWQKTVLVGTDANDSVDNTNQFRIIGDMSNASKEYGSFELLLQNADSGQRVMALWQGVITSSIPGVRGNISGGLNYSTAGENVDAIKFASSSGNISGTFTLYGIIDI